MAKKTAKPAQKPAARPTPKPLPRPRQSPIDLVRNPNFDAAMAEANYRNSMADQRGRIDAERGLATANSNLQGQLPPQGGGNQDFTDSRDPNKMYTQDMVDYIDPATGERTSRTRGVVPAPGSRFVPVNKAGMYRDPRDPNTQYGGPAPELKLPPQGPQEGGGMGGLAPQQPGRLIPLPGFERQQAQQMQDYQNFLQQGMQNSNTMNQGAMASFANTQPGMQVPQIPQPGMQVPQAGIGQPNNPNMAGMATQQRRQNPTLRKFSTVSNSPARFA